jgi:hypothetical protein
MALVFAYLGGVCFPKEQDAEGNPRAVGLVAQNRSVICRTEGIRGVVHAFEVWSNSPS